MRITVLLDKFTILKLTVNVRDRLLISVTIGVNRWCEGAEEKRLDLNDRIERLLEVLCALLLHESKELVAIIHRDETILEDTHALVSPQLDQVVVFGDGSWVRLGDTLEDLGHITQIVSVMRLGWGGSESLTGLLIGGDGSTNHAVLLTLDT